MDYTKDYLIKKAIKKLDNLNEEFKNCITRLNKLNSEREVIRYLLFLGVEKDDSRIDA